MHRRCDSIPLRIVRARALLQASLVAIALPFAAQAGVSVAIVPEATTVEPDSEFVVRVEVTQTGDPFNGYEAHIGFDPGALTFIQASPLTLQEGTAMKNACSNRFHLFDSDPLPLSITHVLLCSQTLLTGPGELYILRFRAATEPQATDISFTSVEFFNSGYSVEVSAAAGATIQIGDPTDVRIPEAASRYARLTAAPNPFNPSTVIELYAPVPGEQTLAVYDPRGRLVRRFEGGRFEGGVRRVVWDGRDDRGSRVASGAYIVTFGSPGRRISYRVVLLK